MSDLLIVTFEDEKAAFAFDEALAGLRRDMRLETQDTRVVTRDADGDVTLRGPVNVPLAQAVGGSVWGLVLGAAFLMPLAGAAVGAATGALMARERDPGLDRAFLEEIAQAMGPGSSALCLWVRKMDNEAFLDTVRGFDRVGKVIQSPLTPEDEARLQKLLNEIPPGTAPA